MTFCIHGLNAQDYAPIFAMTEAELTAVNAMRAIVDAEPGYPCRVSLEDAKIDETVILLNHASMPAPTPFQATHAIYIRQSARTFVPEPGEIPTALCMRTQSVRAFDGNWMLVDADLAEGEAEIAATIEKMLKRPEVKEVHLHNARQGCYAARATRA